MCVEEGGGYLKLQNCLCVGKKPLSYSDLTNGMRPHSPVTP